MVIKIQTSKPNPPFQFSIQDSKEISNNIKTNNSVFTLSCERISHHACICNAIPSNDFSHTLFVLHRFSSIPPSPFVPSQVFLHNQVLLIPPQLIQMLILLWTVLCSIVKKIPSSLYKTKFLWTNHFTLILWLYKYIY